MSGHKPYLPPTATGRWGGESPAGDSRGGGFCFGGFWSELQGLVSYSVDVTGICHQRIFADAGSIEATYELCGGREAYAALPELNILEQPRPDNPSVLPQAASIMRGINHYGRLFVTLRIDSATVTLHHWQDRYWYYCFGSSPPSLIRSGPGGRPLIAVSEGFWFTGVSNAPESQAALRRCIEEARAEVAED